MAGRELQADSTCLLSFPKLPLWIIEYAWAHKMTDIQDVVDPSHWPELGSQPLSIEDSWRLRVASAQVYSIVKNRDMGHFERVMGFLEATYKLLPRLVAPIKHMKIMFGLKTMVVMWMLREGRGMVDTVSKITQFFPSKLPQYQDECNQNEMFLMRKNNLDFKALAQALAMDKDKLEDYIKKQMETQYGEHYAQKVEDRLLHYLRELETVLPGDTFIDKIMKKQSPVTEEEKLLLEVITSDSTTIATTLRKLLHCDVTVCRPARGCQSFEHGENQMESSQLSKSVSYGSSSATLHKSVEGRTPLEFQPKVCRTGEKAVDKNSSFLLENDNHSDVRKHQLTKESKHIKRVEDKNSDEEKQEAHRRRGACVQEASSSPQFCTKHQRWVNSILQECTDECAEELLLRTNVSLSPLLFPSSSSTSSSQDLTPSDLIPCPPDQQHPPSLTSTHPQTAAPASEQTNPNDKQRSTSANNTSQPVSLPQPSLSRNTCLPTLLSPVVRLIDITSVLSGNKQTTSASSPHVLTSPHYGTSRNKDATFEQLESAVPTDPSNTRHKLPAAPVNHDASTVTSCQTATLQSYSRLSRKFRQAVTTTGHSQTLNRFRQNPLAVQFKKAPTTFSFNSPPFPNFSVATHVSTSASPSGTLPSVCTAHQNPSSTKSPLQVFPPNAIKPHPHSHNTIPFQSKTLPYSTVMSPTSSSDCLAVCPETCGVLRAQLRLSLSSQALLLQSTLLQPYVSLTRLSAQECYRVTKGRSSTRHVEPVLQSNNDEEREENEEDSDYSFDPNTLYSRLSSSSDSKDFECDPDYEPCIKKKRQNCY